MRTAQWFTVLVLMGMTASALQCGGPATCATCPPGSNAAAGSNQTTQGDAEPSTTVQAQAWIPCPQADPSEGAACREPTAPLCSYGDSPRPECRDLWTCTSGLWHAIHQGCPQTPAGYCPDSQPLVRTSCSVSGPADWVACVYPGNVLCTCECDGAGACTPTHFVCYPPPTTPGCPSILPNEGQPCAVQGTRCLYGNPCGNDGTAVLCRAGVWSAGLYTCPD